MIELENLIPWRRVRGWKCVRCGFCCSTYDVPVSIDEEARLGKYGNVFRKGKLGVYLKRKEGSCIFKAKWGCKIYDERPLACVLYPFYIRNTGEEEAKFTYNGVDYFVYLDKNCRGINQEGEMTNCVKYVIKMKNVNHHHTILL